VVKPAVAGSSVGIARAASTAELRRAVGQAIQFGTRILIERAVEDRLEVQCAVLGNHDLIVSECEELVRAAGIVSYEDKYLRRVETAEEIDIAPSHIPARIPEDLARQVKSLAAGAFRALDARGIARVDVLVDRVSDPDEQARGGGATHVGRVMHDVEAGNARVPRSGRQQRRQHLEGRGLARTVGAEQPEHFAYFHRDRQCIYGR